MHSEPHGPRFSTLRTSTADEEKIKPLLRGWFHALASPIAVIITVVLLAQTYNDLIRFVSLLIFGVSMIALYVGSAIYHIGSWQGRRETVLRAIDHANIFLLIAGTYTPFCVNVLTGWTRILVLTLIWTFALGGAIGTVATLHMPRWLLVSLYLGMGWIAVLALPQLVSLLPSAAIWFMIAGGFFYTAGGIVYALRWPNPLPRHFGFHEIFHLFTLAGGAAFIIAIWRWVVPFGL